MTIYAVAAHCVVWRPFLEPRGVRLRLFWLALHNYGGTLRAVVTIDVDGNYDRFLVDDSNVS